MKKIILVILLCTLIMLGLTGCNTVNSFDIGYVSDIKVTNKDVSLSIKEGTLTNTSATVVLKNDSDKILNYDDVYEIEIKKDNKWHKINIELSFDLPLWEVKQNSKKEIKLNWKNEYGNLAPGEYRIIKAVYFGDETNEKFYISTEFFI